MTDTTRYYVPGHAGTKALMTALGLAISALGLFELSGPFCAWTSGGRTVGEIVKVVRTAPGETDRVFNTPGTVERDRNPRAVFWHYIEFQTADGANHVAKLTSASSSRPIYSVGEQIRIAPVPGSPDLAVPLYDLRTWVFGGVFTGLGLFVSAIFGVLLRRCRDPIPVPPDTPHEAKALL